MEQSNKVLMAETQQRELEMVVRLWLMSVRDKMAPAAQARYTSPRPVALAGKVRACLGASWAQRLGRVEEAASQHSTQSQLSQTLENLSLH